MPYQASQFAAYPPLAKTTAIEHLLVLNELPLAFAPFLLKELIGFDSKFPAERNDLLAQFAYLSQLSATAREQTLAPFDSLHLSTALESFDAVNQPGEFLEKLSAHLWATSQMDTFRTASEHYMRDFRKAHPEPAPTIPRLAIVLIGQGVSKSEYPLFKKLRRQGTLFRHLDDRDAFAQIAHLLEIRAAAHPEPYAHWSIDGAAGPVTNANITTISYAKLAPIRLALTSKIRSAFESRTSPETLRTELAEITPAKLGMPSSGDPVLDRFHLTLFTEGSGTQIYSTTFVQWTAREALRRARPLTLVTRYAPRVRETSMRELLSNRHVEELDPSGSLIDADMGAWYTWIDMQRLTGADHSNFITLFENHQQAVAVGPAFAAAKEESTPLALSALLEKLS